MAPTPPPPELSLVIPTLGRTEELRRLLRSILDQERTTLSLDRIEILVVDQNEDDRLSAVLAAFPTLPIQRLRIPSRGLSCAKNAGLDRAQGRLVSFPDDDCWYPPETLQSILDHFSGDPPSRGLFFRALTPDTRKPLVQAPDTPQQIPVGSRSEAFWSPQIAQVFPLAPLKQAGIRFDERLGIGTSSGFGSGEDTDFALQALTAGIALDYDPRIEIFHPAVDPTTMTTEKTRLYARGFGAVCRKHGLAPHLAWKVLKQGVGAALSGAQLDFPLARHRAWTAVERLRGFFSFGRD